jgi:hypothetical protein
LITVVTHATGTFTGDMVLPDGKVIASTGKAFDLEFGPNHEVGRRPAHHLGFFGTPLCKRGRSAYANREACGKGTKEYNNGSEINAD